jgi:hypothetical protein
MKFVLLELLYDLISSAILLAVYSYLRSSYEYLWIPLIIYVVIMSGVILYFFFVGGVTTTIIIIMIVIAILFMAVYLYKA